MIQRQPQVAADPAWRLNPLLDLHWRIFDSSCLAFEAVSGETAVIEALDAATLACFEEGAQSLQQLVTELAGDLQVEPNEGLREQVAAVVQEFLARGWLQALKSNG